MISCECAIIGAGFAGAATAYHLTQRGLTDILLVEQESIPGFHSSGRNAAMIRQCVPDPAVARLARDGAAFLRNFPSDWPVPVQFKPNGSLLLGKGDGWQKLKREGEEDRKLGINVEFWSPEQARKRVSVLDEADFDGAVWSDSDGIIDIHALLSGYLKAATAKGARVRYGMKVKSIERSSEGGFKLISDNDQIESMVIVNATGAWANVVARLAGAAELPLRPCRRHLFVSGPLQLVDPGWPFVWDVSHDIYFRPEGQGLLLCACDQSELPPGDPPVDPSMQEMLAEKIHRHIPGLASVSISKSWAGIRTLTSDGRFIIGWDPEVEGFFWVAGLGGHGVTTSSAVGSVASEMILGVSKPEFEAFSPARFSQGKDKP
ncbi:MAG TPA: FAD-dependent oxidoreductase [Candidatus Binatia bacterium]|jgi:D-arginine dehydrogenase